MDGRTDMRDGRAVLPLRRALFRVRGSRPFLVSFCGAQYTAPMQHSSPSRARPIASSSVLSQTYGLFALAMLLTAGGIFLGFAYAPTLLTSGVFMIMIIAELGLIFTAGWWSRSAPLNIILFGLFPLLSGITVTPLLLQILGAYVNGPSILLNAVLATVFLSAGAALFASTTSWNLQALGGFLFMGLLGLLGFGLLQIFVPSLRSGVTETVFSGIGVVLFALFLAYDVQRLQRSAQGGNPFLLALSLYLDIFNLFLFVLRLMAVVGGQRR